MSTLVASVRRHLVASTRKRAFPRAHFRSFLQSQPPAILLRHQSRPCRCYSTENTPNVGAEPASLASPTQEDLRNNYASAGLHGRDRPTVSNPETARMIVQGMLCGPETSSEEAKVVIEAFPGPGMISRAILELPPSKVKRLIILEDNEHFLKLLRPLEKLDPRVTVIPMSGHEWETYSVVEQRKLLDDVAHVPWDGPVHPQLHFISHLPLTIKGEQLIAQLFRCVPEHSWLFMYGRMPMSLILGEWIWSRTSAPLRGKTRCKLSVIAEATTAARYAVPQSALLPYEEHFLPITQSHTPERVVEHRRPGRPLVAVNFIPHADQLIQRGMLEKWDYCLRRLFVLRNTPMKRAISSLAPGAAALLKVLTDPALPIDQRLDVTKAPRDLNVAEWALILRAFDNWPFAPEDLLISDSFSRDPRE